MLNAAIRLSAVPLRAERLNVDAGWPAAVVVGGGMDPAVVVVVGGGPRLPLVCIDSWIFWDFLGFHCWSRNTRGLRF